MLKGILNKGLLYIFAVRSLIFGVLIPGAFYAGFKLGVYYTTESDIDFVSIYGHRMQQRTEKLLSNQEILNEEVDDTCTVGPDFANRMQQYEN